MAMNQSIANSEVGQQNQQFSTFFVANLFFGVDVLQVQEVLKFQKMTPVPKAPGVIEGLINLRGQIVTAIDMRRRLNLPARPTEQTPMNIVITTIDGAVSLLVDEIGDVMEMDATSFELPPANLDRSARQIIRGVYKCEDRLMLVLDADRAADISLSELQ